MVANPLREPWAITEGGLELVIAVATRDEYFADVRQQAIAARDGQPLGNRRKVEMRGSVAVIPVTGPMFRHASMMTDVSGATSYAALRKDLQAALDAPAVKSILLNVDSPGGEANGVSELADAIVAARGQKPITAYVGGTGASAAYWLASAADQIVIDKTAMLGSIGVLTALFDDSKAQEKAGKQRIEMVSSQSPYKRVDPQSKGDRARMQSLIDSVADVFVGAVAKNRGVTVQTVLERFGQGGMLVGQAAIDAGLADRIGSFEAVVAEMAARGNTTSRLGAKSMESIKSAVGLSDAATEEQVGARVHALVKTESALLSATGSANADEAIGRVRANAEASADLGKLRETIAKEQAAQLCQGFRAMLQTALKSEPPRLSLGQLSKVVPSLMGAGRAKALEAVAGVKEQTGPLLLDAICSATIDAAAFDAVKGYLDAQAPVFPVPSKEPDLGEPTANVSDDERSIAEKMGHDPKEIAAMKARFAANR